MLFGGADAIKELLVGTASQAPESATPIEAVAARIDAAADLLHDRRDFARRRQSIIAANPELQERELIKSARATT